MRFDINTNTLEIKFSLLFYINFVSFILLILVMTEEILYIAINQASRAHSFNRIVK